MVNRVSHFGHLVYLSIALSGASNEAWQLGQTIRMGSLHVGITKRHQPAAHAGVAYDSLVLAGWYQGFRRAWGLGVGKGEGSMVEQSIPDAAEERTANGKDFCHRSIKHR